MAVIELDGGAIGAEEVGREHDALPIIFLHGVGSTKAVWRPQLVHFGKKRRAIAFDYPGYGESAPRHGADRDEFARAILQAMDALGIERAHICGLSLGGVIAIAIAHLEPDRVASLILADSFAVHPDGQAIHDRSVAASRAMAMRDLAEARAPLLLGSAASEALKAEVIDTMATIDPEAYRLGAAAVWLADQRDRAAAVNAPALVLFGTEDTITPPALSSELARLIPGARLASVDGAGHLANIEQPAAFNMAVDLFLAMNEPRP
ncbi:alpha/beta fold hydrolase [Sphingomonas rhizophila]|uniref:Alpha/beta fold hydrolase n=1 Tax=Sphingomonas rhizophila TaxID=2071607 RepID=A0A7G9SB46_9SPHN|nr:alpha/beta fold hydrolase [Sphingomonas rhizophila]QNN65071.1 alpha/beta fold hydrolase [Sphingomonas rhizophila]